MAAPATFPPTAPLTASMIKLVISIGDLSCLFFSALFPWLPCKCYRGVS
jgi:hypothetical protein